MRCEAALTSSPCVACALEGVTRALASGYRGCWRCANEQTPENQAGRHMLLHLLESNHWVAAHSTVRGATSRAGAFCLHSRGPALPARARRLAQRGELYCNKCSDFVYDESFNRIRRASFKRPASLGERCVCVAAGVRCAVTDGATLPRARSAWRGDFFCSPAVAANRKRRHLTNQSAAGRGLPPAALNEWISRCEGETSRHDVGARRV